MKHYATPLLVLSLAVLMGPLTAQYQLSNALTRAGGGTGWHEVSMNGDGLGGTYVSGHFLSKGQLPPPRDARYFIREVDDEGQSLRGDCVVSFEGKVPAARWWFLSAASGSERRSMDVSDMVREANGEHVVFVSTNPVPGNWLIPPDSGPYMLTLVLRGSDDRADTPGPSALPRVKRLGC